MFFSIETEYHSIYSSYYFSTQDEATSQYKTILYVALIEGGSILILMFATQLISMHSFGWTYKIGAILTIAIYATWTYNLSYRFSMDGIEARVNQEYDTSAKVAELDQLKEEHFDLIRSKMKIIKDEKEVDLQEQLSFIEKKYNDLERANDQPLADEIHELKLKKEMARQHEDWRIYNECLREIKLKKMVLQRCNNCIEKEAKKNALIEEVKRQQETVLKSFQNRFNLIENRLKSEIEEIEARKKSDRKTTKRLLISSYVLLSFCLFITSFQEVEYTENPLSPILQFRGKYSLISEKRLNVSNCLDCGKSLFGKSPKAKFCNSKCKNNFWNSQKKK